MGMLEFLTLLVDFFNFSNIRILYIYFNFVFLKIIW